MKESYMEFGLDSFNEIHTLELLLFYAIPRKDTDPIAHGLLERFGSLSAVFDASARELMEVPGVGPNAAALITMIPQLNKKIEISRVKDVKYFDRAASIAKYLIPRFMNEKDELVLLLCLDNRNCLVCLEVLNRGVVNAVDVSIRRLVECALKHRSTSVVLAHNHPAGPPLPSLEDEAYTEQAQKALRLVGIHLQDHIIISGKHYISMGDHGLLRRSY